jgi:hypothetical protein
VYNGTSGCDAVARLNAIVQYFRQQAIPRTFTRKSKFPHWFSSSLQYYFKKIITIKDVLKIKIQAVFTIYFPSIIS